MTELACAWVRDRLPDHARDALDIADRARLEQHLAGCDECRSEAALVGSLAIPVGTPADLEVRVLTAVRSRGAGKGVRVRGFRHYALAASFVFAVITGSLLWQQFGDTPAPATPDVEPGVAMALPAGSEPMLHESGLQSLSEDELRMLLEELES